MDPIDLKTVKPENKRDKFILHNLLSFRRSAKNEDTQNEQKSKDNELSKYACAKIIAFYLKERGGI